LKKLKNVMRTLYTSKYAVVTNTVTAGVFTFTYDRITQHLENRGKDKEVDWVRLKSMTTVGSGMGIICHYWYKLLDTRFPGGGRNIVKKIACDLMFSPFYYTLFTGTLCLMKGWELDETFREIVAKIPILFLFDCVFWSTFQGLNFWLLPAHYRIIGVKINDFILGVLQSHILNNDYNYYTLKHELKQKAIDKCVSKDKCDKKDE